MISIKKITIAAGLAFIFLGAGTVGKAHAENIDTTVDWTGGGYIFCSDCYYGQVFTVPSTHNVLDSVTFFLSGSNPVINFKSQIVPWNPNTFQSGEVLYTSDTRSNANFPGYNGTRFGYASVTFTPTGGLSLTPNSQYVAYLRTEPGDGTGAIGNNFDIDSYLGGYHLFGSPPNGWYNANDTRDYAFQASFSAPNPVPEPSSILGALSALCFGAMLKQRQKMRTRF